MFLSVVQIIIVRDDHPSFSCIPYALLSRVPRHACIYQFSVHPSPLWCVEYFNLFCKQCLQFSYRQYNVNLYTFQFHINCILFGMTFFLKTLYCHNQNTSRNIVRIIIVKKGQLSVYCDNLDYFKMVSIRDVRFRKN